MSLEVRNLPFVLYDTVKNLFRKKIIVLKFISMKDMKVIEVCIAIEYKGESGSLIHVLTVAKMIKTVINAPASSSTIPINLK